MNYRWVVTLAMALIAATAMGAPTLAVYVEYGGKVIELHSDIISPLYDGLGEVIYTAWEADELASPESNDRIGMKMYLIGWRRSGDQVIIYFDRQTTITLPESDMKYKIIDRPGSTDSEEEVVQRQTS